MATNSVENGVGESLGLIQHLKNTMDFKFVGVQGYCWGGKIAVKLSHEENFIGADAVIATHPTGLAFPSDIAKIRTPICFILSEHDREINIWEWKCIKSSLEKLRVLNMIPSYNFKVFVGMHHGFAVRGNENEKFVRASREEAFEESAIFLEQNDKVSVQAI